MRRLGRHRRLRRREIAFSIFIYIYPSWIWVRLNESIKFDTIFFWENNEFLSNEKQEAQNGIDQWSRSIDIGFNMHMISSIRYIDLWQINDDTIWNNTLTWRYDVTTLKARQILDVNLMCWR